MKLQRAQRCDDFEVVMGTRHAHADLSRQVLDMEELIELFAWDAALKFLTQNSKMLAHKVRAKVLGETGQTISPANISRLWHKLKNREQ